MDDITSRDDEKRLELAREQGQREEQDRQRGRELATEKGRKQGLDEERTRERKHLPDPIRSCREYRD
jgi:hypothetical protein